jgi:hypothetical protein
MPLLSCGTCLATRHTHSGHRRSPNVCDKKTAYRQRVTPWRTCCRAVSRHSGYDRGAWHL